VICAGQLNDNVECESLHILPGGKLNGDIMANHVIIDGLVIGNVKAERVQMV
jgi:cytoskeletal protein CcmA (bactofilin family)